MVLGLGGSIGHAYVEVTVRGDGMDSDVRRILNDAVDDADLESVGRRAGQDFTKGFSKETKEEFDAIGKSPDWKRAIENLDWTEAMAKNTDDYFKSPSWKAFVQNSAHRWEDVGELAAKEMEAGFRARGNLDGIEDEMRRMQERINATRERLRKQTTAEILRDEKKAQQEIERLARETMKARESEFNTRMNMEKQILEFRKRQAQEEADTQKDLEAARLAGMRTEANMERLSAMFAKQRIARAKEEKKEIDRRNKEIERLAGRTSAAFAKFENGVGALFGRGSRNNFINIIGSAARGLAKLVTLVPKVALAVGKHLAESFNEAGGGMRGAAMVGSQLLGGALLGLAATGPVVVAAFAAMSFAIGPFAALLSGLLGTVLALASTLAFALVGAIGAVAAALVPLAAGIGVVVLGFKSMTDAQKDALKVKVKPLTDAFKGLGQTAFKALSKDVGETAKDLVPVIKSLNPVVEGLGTAIGNIAQSWTKSMRGEGFTKFVDVITRTMPGMLESLGDSIGNALGGLGGLFRGAIPAAQRFLGWLEDITQTFSDWANSAKGQREIHSFFRKAEKSVQALSGFLDAVWDTTLDILSAGEGTGDTLFETMEKNVRKFGDYLEAHPDALKDFFANAKTVATDLGNVAVNLGKIFDELDDDENRKNLHSVMDVLNAGLSGDVSKDQGTIANLTAIGNILHDWTDPLDGFKAIWNSIDWGRPKGISWGDLIPPIKASDIIPGNFESTIGSFFSDAFGRINWGAMLHIHWGAIIPDIHWRDIIPRIGWKDLIPKIGWGDLLPDLSWKSLIPSFGSWGKYIPHIPWDALIPDLTWSQLIPKISWGAFVPDIGWDDLLPDLEWGDIIPDLSWSDFIPDIPTIHADIDWPSPPGWLAKITGNAIVVPPPEMPTVNPLTAPLSGTGSVVPMTTTSSSRGGGLQWPGGGTSTGGKTINVGGITINTPTKDPSAAAQEVVNRLVATGY